MQAIVHRPSNLSPLTENFFTCHNSSNKSRKKWILQLTWFMPGSESFLLYFHRKVDKFERSFRLWAPFRAGRGLLGTRVDKRSRSWGLLSPTFFLSPPPGRVLIVPDCLECGGSVIYHHQGSLDFNYARTVIKFKTKLTDSPSKWIELSIDEVIFLVYYYYLGH